MAAGAETAVVADPAEPPKLKKLEMSFPSTALAKSLGQYDSTLIPAALTRVEILSPI